VILAPDTWKHVSLKKHVDKGGDGGRLGENYHKTKDYYDNDWWD
jgi:hypothetical protein